MNTNYQRKGSKSNSDVGKKFEDNVKKLLETKYSCSFKSSSPHLIGVNKTSVKNHSFDLCSEKKIKDKYILVECKSYTWTKTDNVPSSKITACNQEMYYFSLLQNSQIFRKLFVVKKSYSTKRDETLAQYYIRLKSHLIPNDVYIFEYDEENNFLEEVRKNKYN